MLHHHVIAAGGLAWTSAHLLPPVFAHDPPGAVGVGKQFEQVGELFS
jgi:hypothetical protein